jgi:nitrogenase molybdenum-iron protein alpha/beta subunit
MEQTEPPRYGALDEPFWKHQEARLAGQLGQPCCTLSGMCTLLGGMGGNFAVVIHGERDCGNSFVHHRMESAEQFFCTCLTEDEITTGRVDEPLERCLRLVLDELAPDAVFVLGTCPVTMIGADLGPVVERVAAQRSTPILALRTGGLNLSTQAEMVDWLYTSLAGLPQVERDQAWWRRHVASALHETVVALHGEAPLTPEDVRSRVEESLVTPPLDRCVNFIGLPAEGVRSSELVTVLHSVDIQVTGLYPFEADLRGWRSITHAAVNVVADRRLYPRLLARLEQEHAMPTVEVPLPIGLQQSLRFYRAIGEFFDVWETLERALAPQVEAAKARVEAFRIQAAGTRVAMGIRMLNNYQADQLAYEGLGDVEALTELGFEPTLLIQGPPEERPRFEEMLAALGVTLPMHVFPNPWNLAPLLAEGNYQVAYLADHSWEEAQKAGVPMIKSRSLAPLLAGVDQNLTVLAELLRAAGQKRGEEA